MAVFLMASLMVSPSYAQDSKPKLVEVILNEQTSDPSAENVIRKIYSDWIKDNNTRDEIGDIDARFVSLAKDNGQNTFVIGILRGEDFGGCYNQGCRTVIFHSKGNNEWVGVFNAFVTKIFYDENSNSNVKNLILSSNIDGSNPGIWMWNGTGFQIVNAR